MPPADARRAGRARPNRVVAALRSLWAGPTGRRLSGNIAARAGSMVVLALATLLMAHTGGPAGVGEWAMLRVLTGLVGVVAALGLPTSCTYFLAAPGSDRTRVARTVVAIALASGIGGSLVWVIASPVVRHLFFRDASTVAVALAATTVLSQLLVTTARSCMQGIDDLHGSNVVFVLEEAGFIPVFPLLAVVLGWHTFLSVVVALLASDLIALVYAWPRLLRAGFLRGTGRPSRAIARQIVVYGSRAQLGGILTLLNLRLDFVVLGLLTGPAVVGVYGVASKYAELLRVPPLALTYVLYPRFARDGVESARRAVSRMLLPSVGVMALGAAALAVVAPVVLPALYGKQFDGALTPALVLLVGMLGEGATALLSAYFYGARRPGLNSVGTGVGLVLTVVLDLTLIPRWGAVGAAVASWLAYASVTVFLTVVFLRIGSRGDAPASEALLPEPVAPLPAPQQPVPPRHAAAQRPTPQPVATPTAVWTVSHPVEEAGTVHLPYPSSCTRPVQNASSRTTVSAPTSGDHMQLDEALARLVRRHALLHLTVLVLALVGIGLVVGTSKVTYEARGRVLLTAQPATSNQEAQSIAARAQAAVTSDAMITRALAGLGAAPGEVARLRNEVSLQQLGTSTAADIVVTDRDPRLAGTVAGSLVRQIVAFNNQLELGRVDQAVADIDRQLKDLQAQQDRLNLQDAAAANVPNAKPDPVRARREAAITQLQQQLGQDRSRLVVGQQLTASATVMDDAPARGVPTSGHNGQYAALILLGAFALSGLLAALLEAVRPTLPGPRYGARELGVPLLPTGATAGEVSQPVAARLLSSARQAGCRSLVLVGPVSTPVLRSMAERLEAALADGARAAAVAAEEAVSLLPAAARAAVSVGGGVNGSANGTTLGTTAYADEGSAGGHHAAQSLIPAQLQQPMRVVVADATSLPAAAAPAVVAVLPRTTPRSHLEDVRDLAASTGWPVLGVLPAPRHRRRFLPHTSRSRKESR